MLGSRFRFHGHGSLRYVFKNGDTFRYRCFTIRVSKNRFRAASRFSVSVSKKIYKSAVKRNRIRRRIYEVIRLSEQQPDRRYDVVVIVVSQDVLTMSTEDLQSSLSQLLKEAQVLA